MRAEPAAPGVEAVAEALVQGLGDLGLGGIREARAVALASVGVERELADAEDLAIAERLVHAALRVLEDPQGADLVGQPVTGLLAVPGADPEQDEEARADLGDPLAIRVDRGDADALDEGSQAGSARGGREALAVDPVIAPLGAQVGRDREVATGAVTVAAQRERAAEAEMGEVVDRVALDDSLELGNGLLEPSTPEERPAQGLANRALLRGEACCLSQRHRRLLVVARLEQRHPLHVQRIEGILLSRHPTHCTTAALPIAGPRRGRGSRPRPRPSA